MRLQGGGAMTAAAVDVGPEKLMPSVPAGGMRSLAVTVTNKSDGAVTCGAKVDGSATGGWVTLSSSGFALPRGQKKTVGVLVRVPAGTPSGKYTAMITVGAGADGSALRETTIPVEVQVSSSQVEK